MVSKKNSPLDQDHVLTIARAIHAMKPYVYGRPEDGPIRAYLMPEVTSYVRNLSPSAFDAVWSSFSSGNQNAKAYIVKKLVHARRDYTQGLGEKFSKAMEDAMTIVPDDIKGVLDPTDTTVDTFIAWNVLAVSELSKRHSFTIEQSRALFRVVHALCSSRYGIEGAHGRGFLTNRHSPSGGMTISLRNYDLMQLVAEKHEDAQLITHAIETLGTDDAQTIRAVIESEVPVSLYSGLL